MRPLLTKAEKMERAARLYSVAEHSVLVSLSVPGEFATWGLLHDAAEAYCGDMVRPLKQEFPGFKIVEREIMKAVAIYFHLSGPMPVEVKEADNRALITERDELFGTHGPEWCAELECLPRLSLKPRCLEPVAASRLFIDRFTECVGDSASQRQSV